MLDQALQSEQQTAPAFLIDPSSPAQTIENCQYMLALLRDIHVLAGDSSSEPPLSDDGGTAACMLLSYVSNTVGLASARMAREAADLRGQLEHALALQRDPAALGQALKDARRAARESARVNRHRAGALREHGKILRGRAP